jgi:hypothetical protein
MISFRACRVWTTTALVLVLFVVLTSSSAPAAGARHEKRAKCPASAADSVIANGDAEVYVALGRGADEGLEVAFGCAYAQGRSYRLGIIEKCIGSSAGGCGVTLENETLVGPIVAYSYEVGGPYRYGMFARNLRNGRLLRQASSVGPTIDLVAKSDGAMAWIVVSRSYSCCVGPPPELEVRALDKSGNRRLAAGTGIAPRSLALAGNTLYWTQGGKPMSAVLN